MSTALKLEQETALANRNELATAQLQAQAIAFEQAAFLIAQKRPRDMDVVRQKLMKECERTSFATTAIYRKPVGNSTVMGLSIRYAEAALNVLGNSRTKRIVTLDDLTRRKILIVVSDLESNTHYEAEITIEKSVERRSLKEGQNPLGSRLNSKGDRVYLVEATEDDMLTKESAIASKFIRQNALRLVPGWLQDECYDAILETQKKKAAADPDAEKNKILDSFDELGIRADQIKAYLGVESLDNLTPKDLIELRAVYQGIRDGETNWREVMEQRNAVRGTKDPEVGKPAETRTAAVADQLKQRVAAATGKPQEATKSPEVPPTPPEPEKAKEEAIPPKETVSPAPPEPEILTPDIIQQEVKVVDVERRNRRGRGQFWLLSCAIEGTEGELMIHVWKTDLFDYVSKAPGKVCDFGLKRSEKDDSVFYSLEEIYRIGDQAFLDNKPATVPTAGQLGFE